MAKLYASKAEFGVSFKFTTARPLDDRLVVDQAADIYDPATWGGADKCTLYTGLTVATSGGTLYTYTGPAGDAAFAASLVAGKIPTENWKVQGGDTQAEVGNLADKVTKLETATNENKAAIAAVKATADKAVVANDAIIKAADFSIVKYDAKGLVTEGKVLTAAEVPGLSDLTKKVNNIGITTKTSTDYAKVYTFTGPNGPVDINIPQDLVVKSGEVITATTETGLVKGDKYIKLTIANKEGQPIYIAVKDLVDVYTAQAKAAQVQLAISGTNEISATIVPGSIAKIDLADTVQASLTKADAAAPQTALDAANAEITKIKADVEAHGVKSVDAIHTGDYVTASATTDTETGKATITVGSTPALATAVTKATSALQVGDVTAGTGMFALNVKDTTVTVPHGTMAEKEATNYLTTDETNEAINTKADEINGTINTTKADLEGKITALENAKLKAGAGITISPENNNIAVKKFAVAATPTLSVDASNGVKYTNELTGAADQYVDSKTLADIVNNTNSTVVTTVNALNTKVANASSTAAKKLDNVEINGVKGTVAASGGLQIATVTLDATKIMYNNGTSNVKLSDELDDILDTLQWTEVSETSQA